VTVESEEKEGCTYTYAMFNISISLLQPIDILHIVLHQERNNDRLNLINSEETARARMTTVAEHEMGRGDADHLVTTDAIRLRPIRFVLLLELVEAPRVEA